jgi:putative nucleotidyltransferase with HDIG domain
MLSEPHDPPPSFRRRDALRLVVAGTALFVGLALGVIYDLTPPGRGFELGSIASAALDAPDAAVAWLLLNLVVAGTLLGWIWRFRPEYWHRSRTLILIGLMLTIASFLVRLPAGNEYLVYMIPTAAVGMLLAVLLDAGTGTVVTAILAIIAGLANGASLEYTAWVFLPGLAGMTAVRNGDRVHFFVQAAMAVVAVDVAILAVFSLFGAHDTPTWLQLSGISIASAAVATVVTIGTFAMLGNLFGILTCFQLLELANPSQPLLRRLLNETPGTYHHALMVGNLSERAAEAIGADALLVRVAAYYHDVGKLANPLAFIENQAGGENIHDRLSPEDSAALLKRHVADGMALAERARLPKPLVAFIPQHHGTALLGYAYGKAREEAVAKYGGLQDAAGRKAADGVDQRRFRHAGPKPQTREAAILMLADGVEASVRSLSSRDEATIRAMVVQIIQERLNDGQLNECDLTIRDLERVREAFVSQLVAMYHQRIAYPQSKIVEIEARRERSQGR